MSDESPFSKIADQFGQSQSTVAAMDYSHPDQDKLRSILVEGLRASPTGAKLLQVAEQNKIAINIIRHKAMSGFIPEARAVFVGMVTELSTAIPELILSLGAYLRQAELQILGVKNPDNSMSSRDYTVAYDIKMLDSITVMCKIASELNAAGRTEFVDALSRLGHGDMYRAFVAHGVGQELVNTYYNRLNKV